MSEENICKCEHLFYDHGYEKNENPPPHMKSPCKKCECNYFQRPGSQPHVARSIAKTAARQAAEDHQRDLEDQEHLRSHEGRRKYAEIEAKKVEEKEKDLERIRNEYPLTYAISKLSRRSRTAYSPHIIKGPFFSGIYWSKKNYEYKWKTDPLTKMLTWNKDGLLTEDSLEGLSDIMYKTLEQNTDPDNIEIIVSVPNHLRHSDSCESRCKIDKPNENAPPLAKALAAMICKKRNRKNCHSYDDILVRFLKSDPYRKQAGVHSRHISAKKDYCIAEYIKENNHLIKDQIVLLIDDIKTSGSTAKVCAGFLCDNGAREVIILCAAETKLG